MASHSPGSLAATHHTRACDQRVSMREREDTGELASWGGWSPPLLKLGRERPGASGSGWMGPEWPKVGQALVWNWTPQGGAVSGHPPLSTGRPVDGSWVRAGGRVAGSQGPLFPQEVWGQGPAGLSPAKDRCDQPVPSLSEGWGAGGLGHSSPEPRFGLLGRAARLSLNQAEPPRLHAESTP